MKANVRTMAILLPSIGLALALLGLLLLGWRYAAVQREATGLRDWQAVILRQISAASGTGEPLRPADAIEALSTIVAGRDAAKAMARTLAAVPRAEPSRQLATAVTPKDSAGEISRLRRTQSTGTAAGDAQIIEDDSRAAWTGWKR